MNLTHRAGLFMGLLTGSLAAAIPVASATTSQTDRSGTPLTTISEAASVLAQTVLVTTAEPTTAPVVAAEPSTTTPPPTPVDPPVPGLASGIPAVDGYSIAEVPADDVLWRVYGFPADLTLNHALVVGADGVPVARLIVASASGERPAIDTFVERMYDEQINLPLDVTPMADGAAVVLNGAIPVWTEMEGNAVMRAEQEIDGNFQWAWGADDLVWIVRGKSIAEDYVRALLRVHATSLDPYDTQGLVGDLWDHTPSVPGYQYHDFPAPPR